MPTKERMNQLVATLQEKAAMLDIDSDNAKFNKCIKQLARLCSKFFPEEYFDRLKKNEEELEKEIEAINSNKDILDKSIKITEAKYRFFDELQKMCQNSIDHSPICEREIVGEIRVGADPADIRALEKEIRGEHPFDKS